MIFDLIPICSLVLMVLVAIVFYFRSVPHWLRRGQRIEGELRFVSICNRRKTVVRSFFLASLIMLFSCVVCWMGMWDNMRPSESAKRNESNNLAHYQIQDLFHDNPVSLTCSGILTNIKTAGSFLSRPTLFFSSNIIVFSFFVSFSFLSQRGWCKFLYKAFRNKTVTNYGAYVEKLIRCMDFKGVVSLSKTKGQLHRHAQNSTLGDTNPIKIWCEDILPTLSSESKNTDALNFVKTLYDNRGVHLLNRKKIKKEFGISFFYLFSAVILFICIACVSFVTMDAVFHLNDWKEFVVPVRLPQFLVLLLGMQ